MNYPRIRTFVRHKCAATENPQRDICLQTVSKTLTRRMQFFVPFSLEKRLTASFVSDNIICRMN